MTTDEYKEMLKDIIDNGAECDENIKPHVLGIMWNMGVN